MTDAHDAIETRAAWLPLALVLAGVVMVCVLAIRQAWGNFFGYANFLALGGPVAVGAAAVLGRRASLTIKQLVFLLVACSVLGGLANSAGYALWPSLGIPVAAAIGQVAGTVVAVVAAYIAAMLIRRGARARRTEEIVDTFR